MMQRPNTLDRRGRFSVSHDNLGVGLRMDFRRKIPFDLKLSRDLEKSPQVLWYITYKNTIYMCTSDQSDKQGD
jgi:hypothetical protein